MTTLQPLALYAGCVLLGIGVVGLVRTLAWDPVVRTRVAAHHTRLAVDLAFLQWTCRARTLIVAQACVIAIAVAIAAWLASPSALVLVFPALLCPGAFLAQRRAARVAQLEAQLDTWLTTVANALKANPSLGEALQSSIVLTSAPLCAELDLVIKAQRLGTPLDRALSEMAARVGSRVVTSALTTLRIARQTGGNLSATLEASAASLRELARVEGVVRSRTAEGRAQSLLIGSLPAVMFFVLDLVDPDFLAPLFASTRGHLVLAAAALMWTVAFAWSRRIVAVDV